MSSNDDNENENDKTLITIKKLNNDLDEIIDKSKSLSSKPSKIAQKSRKYN